GEEEDDDELLLAAAAEADPGPDPNPGNPTLYTAPALWPTSTPTPTLHPHPTLHPEPAPCPAPDPAAGGFCSASGALWIYPTNRPVRGYQLRMARAALFANTLVCLPTGLGKTFVAAVVMYNFYRWFPSGKVLWGPGRGTQALSRRELWATRRVFFLTPQIMVNDLSRGTCPAVEIKCLVVDEAHKALGNHAYCQVVKELSRYTNQFRILALSATPGSDTKAVQQVVSNLLIAQIELCAEDSPEIQPYSHERQVEKIVVPLGEELVEIQSAYIQVLEAFAGRLIKMGVLARRDIPSLTKYQIILARDQYRKNPSPQNVGMQQGIIEGDFALCISLYHGYELLLQMGLRSLFIYLCGIMDGSKGLTRTKNELGRNEGFMRLYQQLRDMFSDTYQISENGNLYKSRTVFENKKGFIYSHPKLKKLEEIVIQHFKSWKTGCADQGPPASSVDTRVMIFSSFRDSVQEIAEMLSRFSPLVRVMTFVGHSTGKSTKGFTQKEQLEVVKRFREGGYNTLVSTCVGEEGLDIGEVDLIVCFDAQKSPIRLVQRMGRTGRRRRGRIVVILAEGREERTYNQSQSNKRSILKAISGNKMLHFYQHSPRMIPEGINPELHKMFITAEKYEPNDARRPSRGSSGSLQHKSALFSCVTGPKQVHGRENWSLSPEEFEVWDRLYRIKESDGVKEPVLPRTKFETLENLDETSKPEEEAAHQLSLSEWSLWQNRPFPTSMVEHSDRCYHFISVMEMIEVMRQEQGDCSYELELQPHLRIEDVCGGRSKSRLPTTSSTCDQRARSSRKDVAHKGKPFLPDTNDNETEFFSVFKTTNLKTPKRTSGLELEERRLPAGTKASDCCPAGGPVLAESAAQGSQEEEDIEKVTFDLNEFNDLCDDSESTVAHEGAAIKEFKAVDKACGSLGMSHADLGSSSFTAEKSPVCSDLFYLPESYSDSLVLVRSSEEPAWLEEAFSSVKKLLSRSPPPVNKLYDFEKMLRSEETIWPLPKAVSSSYSEQLQDTDFPASSEADHPLLPSETPELKATRALGASVNTSTSLSNAASSSQSAAGGAREGLPWGDSFDNLLDSEEFLEIQKKTPTNDSLIKNPSNKYFVHEDTEDFEMKKKNVVGDEEKSIYLFEDEHIYETNSEILAGNMEPSVASGSGGDVARPAAAQGSEGLPSKESCTCGHQPCRERPESRGMAAVEVLGAGGVTGQILADSDPYDSSQELFSVNFDLGFSIEECEEEISEEDTNTSSTPKLNGASGSRAVVKFTEDKKKFLSDSCRLQTSPRWDWKSLERRSVSTPLPSWSRSVGRTEAAGGEGRAGDSTGRGDPAALASTPTGRKVRGVEAAKRIHKGNTSSCRKNFGSSALDAGGSAVGGTGNLEGTDLRILRVCPAEGTSSESEEEIVFRRKNRKANVLKSPDVVKGGGVGSLLRARRKRRRPPGTVRGAGGREHRANHLQGLFLKMSSFPSHLSKNLFGFFFLFQKAARQFLDEEAELSQHDADCVSSDESDGTDSELSSSLGHFLNDNAEFTQVLDDSEMRGVYLKSVRSPALGSRYRMVPRGPGSMDVFSQVPEQDEAYAEDSFCVAEGEEDACGRGDWSEEEEECVNFDLLLAESCAGGRQQYLTRRRKRLNQLKKEQNRAAPGQKKKPSRIIVLSDSSGEEAGGSGEKPPRAECCRAERGSPQLLPRALPAGCSVRHEELGGQVSALRAAGRHSRMLLGMKASVSEALDFQPGPGSAAGQGELQAAAQVGAGGGQGPSHTAVGSAAPAPRDGAAGLCVLADSREICSGADVISSLKAAHGLRVQVCALGGGDYVVSSRMAVERQLQSELLSPAHRSRVTRRIQRLQGMFERVCVIVEKDRARPGETSRFFPRTQHYDRLLAALLQAGVRLLFSSCQEETAALLKELALLEQRKNAAICVPTEVEGHRQEVLSFYLSIPNTSYLAALNMCHSFGSVRQVANSSPSAIAAGAQVSARRAEELFRYLHYGFDAQLLPQELCARGRSSTAARS
ncbi:FANCM protein, partial [Penelope pileata]|nr:FANCM protein [Penelope pileata]